MIEVRPAGESDCEDIFTWRNDELTRKMSITTDFVEWEAHVAWFTSTLQRSDRLVLVCVEESEKVAMVRFDIEGRSSVVSINVAPHMRGRGLASPCLSHAIRYFKDVHPDAELVCAEVKVENLASQRLFEKVGFVCDHVKQGVMTYMYHFD